MYQLMDCVQMTDEQYLIYIYIFNMSKKCLFFSIGKNSRLVNLYLGLALVKKDPNKLIEMPPGDK